MLGRTTDRDRQQRLREVIAEFLGAVDADRSLDPQDWIDRYADLAPEFPQFVRDQLAIDRVLHPTVNAAADRRRHAAQASPTDDGSERAPRCGRMFGEYEILREVGRGGMGVVYEARQDNLNRTVALKMLRSGGLAADEDLARLRKEAEIAAGLDHPAIVPVYDVGQHDGQPYFTMKLVKHAGLGGTLDRFRRDPRGAARLLAKVAAAVDHAHQRGVLHRDLKPANILLDERGEPHITDFGLSRRMDSESQLTHSGVIVGTPAFMAPEQASPDLGAVTTATDVYGLGAILYAMLTGRPPFCGESVLATLDQVRSCPPEPPSRVNPDVVADLEAICLKCLEKRAGDRYPSAAALLDDLDRFLGGRPVTARPVGAATRAWRWCRGHVAIASLVAALTVLTVALVIGSTAVAIALSSSRQKLLTSLDNESRARAQSAENERAALRSLYKSRVSEALAQRLSGQVGQRTVGLRALREAAALIPRLGLGPDERLRLRNEAIASLSLVDPRDDLRWPHELTHSSSVDLAAERIAFPAPDGAAVQVHRLADDRLLNRLPHPRAADCVVTEFSPDGRFLAARIQGIRTPGLFLVWALDDGQVLVETDSPAWRNPYVRDFAFGSNSDCVALTRTDGMVEIVGLPDARVRTQAAGSGSAFALRFDPSGSTLAIRREEGIDFVEATSGTVLRTLHRDAGRLTHRLAWSPDGRVLADAGDDRTVDLLDRESGAVLRTLIGHAQPVVNVDFHPRGDLIVTDSWDGTSRLWSASDGRQMLRVNERSRQFSSDGRWLAHRNGRFEVVEPAGHASRLQPRALDDSSACIAPHPDGRIVVVGDELRTVWWDLVEKRIALIAPFPAFSASFSDDGATFYVKPSQNGPVLAYPLEATATENELRFRIGQAVRVTPIDHDGYQPSPVAAHHSMPLSTSGVVPILDTTNGILREFAVQHDNASLLTAVTRDGRRFATCAYRGRDVRIWDGRTGELVRSIESAGAMSAFSPDGRVIAVSESGRCSFRDVESGELLHETAAEPVGIVFGPVCFSPDGTMVAFSGRNRNSIQLLAADTYEELGHFDLSAHQMVRRLAFSESSRQIIAFPNEASSVHFFDLAQVRENLGDLDWDSPAWPAESGAPIKPLRVELADSFSPPTLPTPSDRP